MRIVVFGASGAIGSAIAAGLLSRGHEVTGVSRSGISLTDGVTAVAGDASDPARVAELAAGADAVITATARATTAARAPAPSRPPPGPSSREPAGSACAA